MTDARKLADSIEWAAIVSVEKLGFAPCRLNEPDIQLLVRALRAYDTQYVRGWIPVTERMPEQEQIEGQIADFVPVLFYITTADQGNAVCAGRYFPERKRAPWVSLQGSPYRRSEVSHWMPMPEGPK